MVWRKLLVHLRWILVRYGTRVQEFGPGILRIASIKSKEGQWFQSRYMDHYGPPFKRHLRAPVPSTLRPLSRHD